MDSRINILSELQSISPTVARIAPVNPYQIPQGYFEGLAAFMLELTNEPASSVLVPVPVTPYSVPEGYFENLPGQVLSLIHSEGGSELLKYKEENPYQVPVGYFENFAENILRRVKSQEVLSAKEELESLSPLLSTLEKKNPFTIPDGYFDDLSGNVVEGMKAVDFVNEELENFSPLMAQLRHENVYDIPARYFDDLPASILNKVKEKKPARVVSMSFGKKAIRYAAAAVVFGIMVTAGVLLMNRQNSNPAPGSIAQTEEKIQSETQNGLKALSDDELLNFIENQENPLPDVVSLEASAELDGDDVQLMLADIPDAELKQYLVEYADTKELITN